MSEVFKVRNDSGSVLELKTFGIVISDSATVELGSLDRAILSAELLGYLTSGDLVRVKDGVDVSVDDAFIPSYNTSIVQIVVVGTSGDVDFTSVKEAVDSIMDASPTKPYEVWVSPGVYVEDPFVMGGNIRIYGGVEAQSVTIEANDPDEDLITISGDSAIEGVVFTGVTNAAKTAIRVSGVLLVMTKCAFKKCNVGVYVETGANVLVTRMQNPLDGVDQAIDEVFHVESGASLLLMNSLFSVPSALIPAYSVDPIKRIVAVNGGQALLTGVVAQVAYKTANQCCVFVENGGIAGLTGCTLDESNVGVWIGSTGANSTVISQASNYRNCVKIFKSELATAQIQSLGDQMDSPAFDLAAGTMIVGIQAYGDTKETDLIGNVQFNFLDAGLKTEVGDFLADITSAGCHSDSLNIVTDAGGLDVDVAAGKGFVLDTTYEAVGYISWDADILTLPDDSTTYVFIDRTTQVVSQSGSLPNAEESILLAKVVTIDGAVRWIHNMAQNAIHPNALQYSFAASIHKILANTGLVISAGSTSKKLNLGQGSYWIGTTLVSIGAASDFTFDYYYGAGAGESLAETGIDDANYDNAGSLTAMTAGYFKVDTVFMTSDGKVSILYGDAEYATQPEAKAAGRGSAFTALADSAIPLAKLIIEQGNGIQTIQDMRPFIQFGTAAQAGGAPTSHSSLSDLDHDDHTQYFLVAGGRSMGGDLNMGTHAITNVGNVDGVDVSGHAARHLPGAADALTVATPSSVGSANTEGSNASFARSDHVHNHANQAGGALHSAVTAGANGFMVAADKSKLDGIAAGADVTGSNPPQAHAASHKSAGSDAIKLDELKAPDDNTNLNVSITKHGLVPKAPNIVTQFLDGTGVWSTPVTGLDEMVKADSSDPSAGYLDAKVDGTTIENNGTTHKINVKSGVFEPVISPKNTAFNKNFGSGAGDVCQGNDSRLSDARTPTVHAASHKSAGSDSIKLDELAAPTDVTTLNATTGQHGLLPKLGGGTDNFLRADGSWAPPAFPTYQFFADQLDNPVSSEWPVQVVAPVVQDDDNNALSVRHFDDTANEGVGLIVQIPTGATNIRFDFVSRARTAPGAGKGVVPTLYVREISDNAAVEAWSGATDLTTIAIPTNETFQYDNQTIALATLSLVAGRVAQFELIRRPAAAADDLVGDWVLLLTKVSFT